MTTKVPSTKSPDKMIMLHSDSVGILVAVGISVQLAYSVVSAVMAVEKTKAEVRPTSENQPAKVLPALVGAVGEVAVPLYATV